VSARWKRVVQEGKTHTGAKTTQSYIAGIGVSGALLAGAAVTLISLVGLVSFRVWPGAPVGSGPTGQAELNLGGAGGKAAGTTLSAASGLVASSSPLTPGSGAGSTGKGPGGNAPGGKGPGPSPSPPNQPGATPPAAAPPTEAPQPSSGTSTKGASPGSSGSSKKPVNTLPNGKVKPNDTSDPAAPSDSGKGKSGKSGKTSPAKGGDSGTRSGNTTQVSTGTSKGKSK
jgi:hypothetical protein